MGPCLKGGGGDRTEDIVGGRERLRHSEALCSIQGQNDRMGGGGREERTLTPPDSPAENVLTV